MPLIFSRSVNENSIIQASEAADSLISLLTEGNIDYDNMIENVGKYLSSIHNKPEYKAILNEALYKAIFEMKFDPKSKINLLTALILQENGADINARIHGDDANDITLLLLAIQNERWELLDLLLRLQADTSVVCKNEESVLMSAFANKQYKFCDKLILQLLNPMRASNLNGLAMLQHLLSNFPAEHKNESFAHLIVFLNNNIKMPGSLSLLKIMYENDRGLFLSVMEDPKHANYRGFLNLVVESDFSDSNKYINAFSCGRGRIDYEDGLTACAAIACTKSQDAVQFNPTVLNGNEELKNYFEFIRDNLDSIDNQSHKFVVSGDHWISGIIEVKDGKISILFVDSLGKESHFLKEQVKIAREVFQVANIGTEPNIIISNQKRQNAVNGCSIFALDDVRKLFKISELSPYLNLSMMRTTESLTTIEQDQERYGQGSQTNGPVNKKLETFDYSLERNIVLSNPEQGTGKKINKRIDYKLDKLCEKVKKFVLDKSDDEIEELKQKFSLDGFKARLDVLKPRVSC